MNIVHVRVKVEFVFYLVFESHQNNPIVIMAFMIIATILRWGVKLIDPKLIGNWANDNAI
jgi:hypothetical protein